MHQAGVASLRTPSPLQTNFAVAEKYIIGGIHLLNHIGSLTVRPYPPFRFLLRTLMSPAGTQRRGTKA